MTNERIAALGDDLEAAARRSLASARRRARMRRIGGGVIGLTLLAAGTVAAANLFSPKQVAAGMPAGSVIFGQTNPTCVLDADGSTYHCTLASPPQSDSLPVDQAAETAVPAPKASAQALAKDVPALETCVPVTNGTQHCIVEAPGAPLTSDDTPSPLDAARKVAPAAAAPSPTDYTGWKELVGIGGKVAGGCIGMSADGLHWDCYLGQDAVAHEILSENLLNQPMTEPGRG